ncbi:MAG: ATP-binding domain-containing protein, partial [Coprobacter sp.]|nr:ATP-binding domain-containing protein [Coprobacter sp.]
MGNISEDAVSLDFFRWLYTAFTRSTERLYLINTPKYFLKDSDAEL